jgi:DNA-binding PadR family transcriptional regulator
MLDMAILGLLREGPKHGYELHHRLVDMGFWRISFGSVYPALRRLEKNGDITTVNGSGRRKIFELTSAGLGHFEMLLADEEAAMDNSSAFRVRLSLFRYLPNAARVAFLRRRQAVLERRIAAIEEALAAGHIDDRYMRAEMQHRVDTARSDIAWLDELISQEPTYTGLSTITERGTP